MENIIQKYNRLDVGSQIVVQKFIDFLSEENKRKRNFTSNYKKRISEVSVWSENDLIIFDEIKSTFIKWKIGEW